MSAHDLFAAAVDHQKAGRLDQAAALYETILVREPAHADALHYSALIALRRGDTGEAIARLRRATEAAPGRAVTHNDLGAAYRLAGHLPEAAAALEAAVEVDPRYADAWNNLGMVRRAVGDLPGARQALERAAELRPNFAPTYNALGAVLKGLGAIDDALKAFEKAVAIKPDYAEALTNLGLALLDRGLADSAQVPLRKAAALAPAVGAAWLNLALAQRGCGDLQGAVASLRRAVAASPELAGAWNALGVVLAALGDHQGAQDGFVRAARLNPDSAEFHSNLGLALHKLGRNEEALAAIERALSINAAHAEAMFNRGIVRQQLGDFAGALADWKATLAADPGHRVARSNLLFALQYEPEMDGAALFAAALEFQRLHDDPPTRYRDWPNSRDTRRRLRIGYVSPDFREHSVSHFIEPLLGAHDRNAFEIFAYAELKRADAATERLRALADHWRPTSGLPDDLAARRVREDGIDILVDLAGHTADNRLGMFALRPAPVQLTWLGFPGTTGLSAIGYRLTDSVADPPGSERHSSEIPVRLPHGFHCWRPPAGAPPIAEHSARPPTFGSFNNVQKLSAEVVAVWSELLHRVPAARLLLKSSWLLRPRVVADIRHAFSAHGVDPARIDLRSWLPEAASHLAAYAEIDVALDPFPYNGTTTTLEALWMGVPVVTLTGNRHAARVGASLLSHIGLTELIAPSRESYVALAAALIGDPERVRRYRHDLRGRMAASPLLDAASFAADLESVYRSLWQHWCAGG